MDVCDDIEVDVIDEKDQIIGTMKLSIAKEKKMSYRLVDITIKNSSGKILLQKRAEQKRFGGCWSSSAAGHVEKGETYIQAAERELKEELGIKTELTFVNKKRIPYGQIHRMVAFFKGISDEKPIINRIEVESVKYFTKQEVENMINDKKEKFIPIFRYTKEMVIDDNNF
jgi:isopentenyl-diphosphate Delta-isomerase